MSTRLNLTVTLTNHRLRSARGCGLSDDGAFTDEAHVLSRTVVIKDASLMVGGAQCMVQVNISSKMMLLVLCFFSKAMTGALMSLKFNLERPPAFYWKPGV